MEPLVSIITPAYNAESLIVETINSVLAQTYQNWEMIIIDDCSSDKTVLTVHEYERKDERIKLIRQLYNGGVAAARNAGLVIAKGKYIAFLDSDDKWLPDKLQKQVNYMRQNDYVFTYTDYQCFDSDSGKLGKVVKCPGKMKANDILKNTAIFCVTVMVDREKSGDFKMPPLTHTEDNCTWHDILNRGFVAYKLPEVLALYRIGNISLTKNKGKSAKLQWKTYRDYYHFSVLKSVYYFTCYAFHAINKHFI